MKWISVEERFPYLYQDVLVTDGTEPFEYIVAIYMGRHIGWKNTLDCSVKFWCKIPDLQEAINEMD